jgi:phosphotransferase system  glucose/maltose/N-acetylglucosamine-specific IIC component
MSPTTTFFVGLFLGSFMGLFAAALASIAKESDERMSRWYE